MIAYRIAYSSFSFFFVVYSLFRFAVRGGHFGNWNFLTEKSGVLFRTSPASKRVHKVTRLNTSFTAIAPSRSHFPTLAGTHSIYSRAFIVPAAPPFIKRTAYRCRATAYFFQNNIVRRCAFAFSFVRTQTLSGELG